MKILGGEYKGRNFYMPAGIRPTQDTLRQCLFDILGHDMSGKIWLDICAGSGSVGFEALSRGAKFVTMLEREKKNVGVINENAQILGIEAYEIFTMDMFRGIKDLYRQKRKFDIVFVDPPYGLGLAKKALKTLGGYDILTPHSTIIIQHDKAEALEKEQGSLKQFREKKQGHTILSFYNKQYDNDQSINNIK